MFNNDKISNFKSNQCPTKSQLTYSNLTNLQVKCINIPAATNCVFLNIFCYFLLLKTLKFLKNF